MAYTDATSGDLSENGTKRRDAVTLAWVDPVEGTEYLALDQLGGDFGTIYTQLVRKTISTTPGSLFLSITGVVTTLAPVPGDISYRRESNGEWYDNTLGTSILHFQLYGTGSDLYYVDTGFDRVYGFINYTKTMA